jgi:hypothetical protein
MAKRTTQVTLSAADKAAADKAIVANAETLFLSTLEEMGSYAGESIEKNGSFRKTLAAQLPKLVISVSEAALKERKAVWSFHFLAAYMSSRGAPTTFDALLLAYNGRPASEATKTTSALPAIVACKQTALGAASAPTGCNDLVAREAICQTGLLSARKLISYVFKANDLNINTGLPLTNAEKAEKAGKGKGKGGDDKGKGGDDKGKGGDEKTADITPDKIAEVVKTTPAAMLKSAIVALDQNACAALLISIAQDMAISGCDIANSDFFNAIVKAAGARAHDLKKGATPCSPVAPTPAVLLV